MQWKMTQHVSEGPLGMLRKTNIFLDNFIPASSKHWKTFKKKKWILGRKILALEQENNYLVPQDKMPKTERSLSDQRSMVLKSPILIAFWTNHPLESQTNEHREGERLTEANLCELGKSSTVPTSITTYYENEEFQILQYNLRRKPRKFFKSKNLKTYTSRGPVLNVFYSIIPFHLKFNHHSLFASFPKNFYLSY